MAALDIAPHSHRLSTVAVSGVAAVAAGAFALGLLHGLQPPGPSPFPAPQARFPADPAGPKAALQVAQQARPRQAPPPDLTDLLSSTPPPAAATAATVDTAATADAAANAPAPPEPSPEPAPPPDDPPHA